MNAKIAMSLVAIASVFVVAMPAEATILPSTPYVVPLGEWQDFLIPGEYAGLFEVRGHATAVASLSFPDGTTLVRVTCVENTPDVCAGSILMSKNL